MRAPSGIGFRIAFEHDLRTVMGYTGSKNADGVSEEEELNV
ncbi:hypothetical protein ACFLTC_01465 [Chloroflexota bacterium]